MISSAAEGIFSYTRLRDNVCDTSDTSTLSAIIKLPSGLTAPSIVYDTPGSDTVLLQVSLVPSMEPEIPPHSLITPPAVADSLAT